MGPVFLSYVQEDTDVMAEVAHGLEDAGLTTWYFHRDSAPGPSYLAQIAAAIEDCRAIIGIVSPDSIGSKQVTSEISRGFDLGKSLVLLLRGLSQERLHDDRPDWIDVLRAATLIQIPSDGVSAILPRILGGLKVIGIVADRRLRPIASPIASFPPVASTPVVGTSPAVGLAGASLLPDLKVELTATFDCEAYPAGEDPLAYCLLELLIKAAGETVVDGADADLALVLDVSGSMDKPDRYPLLREAVRQFVAGMGPNDRMSITLFSDRAETVVPMISGAHAANSVRELIQRMDGSELLFGPQTILAPALLLALETLGPANLLESRVRRVYVLTDGELHDSSACQSALGAFRRCMTEVHVYGFGDQFNAAALKQLVSDQRGGTVKPICDEQDIVRTFLHLAQINRRLVGQEGKLRVIFAPNVVCGDAWTFRPAGRYLGTIHEHQLEHVFGGLEAGRVYSLLTEIRLPPDHRAIQTSVATLEASWIQAGELSSYAIDVLAPRIPSSSLPKPPIVIGRVKQAFDAVNVLRNTDEIGVVLASLEARRQLAVIEGRDPRLIAALDKMIDNLSQAGGGNTVEEAKAQLTAEEGLYLDSDFTTHIQSM